MVPDDNMYFLLLIICHIIFSKHMFIDTANKIMSLLLDDVQHNFYLVLKVYIARVTIC